MSYTTLISASALHQQLNKKADVIVIDCRFSLSDANAGAYAYRHGHLPNARYAHLEQDLSSAISSYTGRHPLPDFRLLAKKLGRWGVHNSSQVVAYDDANGAFAARLWWLLRNLGHENVAVLDGGLADWQRQGLPLTTQLPAIKTTTFRAYPNSQPWLTALEVENGLATKNVCLIDARATERYLGLQEPIDPVAGHIPGAKNHPFMRNLDQNGKFLPPNVINQHFQLVIGSLLPENVVHYCGSGVTACHNVLAMEYAGLKGSRLYVGSWSEWITNKNRAVTSASTEKT